MSTRPPPLRSLGAMQELTPISGKWTGGIQIYVVAPLLNRQFSSYFKPLGGHSSNPFTLTLAERTALIWWLILFCCQKHSMLVRSGLKYSEEFGSVKGWKFVQATHFVDLMRYLVGNIQKDTIQTLAVGPHQMKLNDMAKPPQAEHPVSCFNAYTQIPI